MRKIAEDSCNAGAKVLAGSTIQDKAKSFLEKHDFKDAGMTWYVHTWYVHMLPGLFSN